MHKRRLLALILLASAALGICSTVCIAQPASEIREDQSALQRADALLKQMTLDEKLQLLVSRYPNNASPGGGAGYVEGVPRLHIPNINISDSGDRLREQQAAQFHPSCNHSGRG